MKALLLNVPREAADRFFSGETSYLPCSQIPDMPRLSDPKVYICVDGAIIGEAWYYRAYASKEPMVNAKIDHYGYNCVWFATNPQRYEKPVELKAFRLKRVPDEWRWVKHE